MNSDYLFFIQKNLSRKETGYDGVEVYACKDGRIVYDLRVGIPMADHSGGEIWLPSNFIKTHSFHELIITIRKDMADVILENENQISQLCSRTNGYCNEVSQALTHYDGFINEKEILAWLMQDATFEEQSERLTVFLDLKSQLSERRFLKAKTNSFLPGPYIFRQALRNNPTNFYELFVMKCKEMITNRWKEETSAKGEQT